MELKDVVLSVLTDIQNEEERQQELAKIQEPKTTEPKETDKELKPAVEVKKQKKAEPAPIPQKQPPLQIKKRAVRSDEELFLRNLKERILVMFEGFNSPKNKNTEAKVDLTINFLEYLLAVTDERLESINASKK